MNTLREGLYGFPKPPPRPRTKPLQVICVGLPRSGTESLSLALTQLGLTTYHGWDIVFEDAPYTQEWAKLAERKYSNAPHGGDVEITRAEFDALLGHCDAVIDTAAALFTVEILQAYPDAKVILNTRRDIDAWHRSALKTLVAEGEEQWPVWFLALWSADLYWLWRLYIKFGYPGLFRGRTARDGLEKYGKRVYREHGWMVRGMVPRERLLEWNVEDGWEPLCEFLGKEVPEEPFPRSNDPAAFRENVQSQVRPRVKQALTNCALAAGVVVTAVVLGVKGRVGHRAINGLSGMIGSWVRSEDLEMSGFSGGSPTDEFGNGKQIRQQGSRADNEQPTRDWFSAANRRPRTR
ncbi:hypothetical protein BO78DRAFT_469493 [Aspergillus sclerotiicarbonarius CBS 121057]|uniref:NAD dependent epimerase/dehydratase n=1 Tax=Aspergillus sclerotiicarbonarius (strain CBS 121057 / IBT 28362) TaxID=1448318 RepID=A0A319EK29_ASPSB|nr:hypothetical protein BO78DRAFT_469493 [Aspergillus sclerotiicarbonarius CBS 121057]